MKINRHLIGALVALGLSTAVAHAGPIVVISGGMFATAVDNLNVDGTVYDVTFDLTTVDPTFQGNPSGALDAANGLLAALNASVAINVEGPGFTADGFTVADNGDLGPIVIDPTAAVGLWSIEVGGGGPPFAQFTVVSTPEPLTLSLFGVGLAGAVAMRRRRKKTS